MTALVEITLKLWDGEFSAVVAFMVAQDLVVAADYSGGEVKTKDIPCGYVLDSEIDIISVTDYGEAPIVKNVKPSIDLEHEIVAEVKRRIANGDFAGYFEQA
jgi:hypothetical protein